MSREWDVLVVGAGPAGSIAARELARRGLTVLFADRATFPRDKVCGCCLNGAALEVLRRIGLGSLPDKLGAVPLDRFRLAANGQAATIKVPGGVALSRTAFDEALIREAVAAGATFQAATIVRRIADGWTLQSANSKEMPVSARVVVVASGLSGRMTSDSDVRADSRIGAGVVVTDVQDDYEPGTIFMATGRGGYVGLVRLEDGRLDVAAAFDVRFVRAAGGPGLAAVSVLKAAGFPEIPGLAELGWRGTPPLTRAPRRRAGPGWFTVGDAAGYVEPFTGEGMAWAVASATAVASVTQRAARSGWSPRFEQEWEDAYTRIIGERQEVCRLMARVLRSPILTRVTVRLLTQAPALAGPVLARLNRPSPLFPEVLA